METRSKLKSVKTIIDNGEEIEVTEGINDIENGGEIEGEGNVMNGQLVETEPEVQTQNQQMKSVGRRGKDSAIDMQAILTYMEKFEERMMKREGKFEERMIKMEKFEERMMKREGKFEERMIKMEEKFEERMMKMEGKFEERMIEMENKRKEDFREMLAALTRDSKCETNQQIESMNNEVEVVSERTHGQIQTLTDTVRGDTSENFETQITRQLNSSHDEENVKDTSTLATQAHASMDQGIVSQEERTLSSDNSTDQSESKLPDTDKMNHTGSGLHGCDVISSLSRSQVICGNLAEVPKTGIEAGDVTEECGNQSCVAQLQLQIEAEEVELRQTTGYRGTATPLNLSERQSRTWVRNWKKRKKTLKDKGTTGTVKSKATSMSCRGEFPSPVHPMHGLSVNHGPGKFSLRAISDRSR